jgi:hypothetical protein
MWWLFGLINVIIVLLLGLFFDRKIKGGSKWTMDDKCSFCVFIFVSFVGGSLVSILLVCLLVYLIIDFIKYTKSN